MPRRTCPKCRAELAGAAMDGLCPKCVAALALATDPSLRGAAVISIPVTEKAGDRVGRYKLLQQIGEGGCGVVYMAEQEDPVRRRVALKVIKLGMDTKNVIARFEAERQALALMDHPNIARVFDGGATDTGRPFFVMELVRGLKMTDYCDQHNLPTAERLKLFVQVCRAIQHAHQKGIIHRDLKPSNILVTGNDGAAVPKVIDFGIAKATQGPLTDKTLFTAFDQFIGTPAYMSPEQAELTGLDADTRSDIYSLGVLLYELLTGTLPFDTAALLKAGLDAMRHAIREEEPVRPRTRLGTMVKGELTTAAKRRQTEPPKLIHSVRGDLDWIVMKCLEKDRARRYETANALALDIEHHLTDEPVVARPPSRLYRFRKAVRRNKLTFAAASAVAAALLVGLGASTWLLARESRARQRAVAAEQRAEAGEKQSRTEAAKSRRVAQFLEDMLASVGPSRALGRDTAMLREILDKTAERVGQDLTNEPEVEIELSAVLAQTYHELLLYSQMEKIARESLQLARSRLGEENLAVARALDQLGDALTHAGQFDEAEKLLSAAVAMRRKLLGNEHADTATSLHHLANVFSMQGRPAEGEPMQREAVAVLQRKLLGGDDARLALWLRDLGTHLMDQGKLADAETVYREALAMRKRLFGNEHPDVADSLYRLARALLSGGKVSEAETLHRQALTIRRKVVGEHPGVAESLGGLADVLRAQGKLAEAETMYREALAMAKKLLGNEHRHVAILLRDLGSTLIAQDKLAEAENTLREALPLLTKFLGAKRSDVTWVLNELLSVLMRQGKVDEVEHLLNDVLSPESENQPKNARLLNMRGMWRGRMGHWKEAGADFSKALEFLPEYYVYYRLAPVLVQSGDLEGYRRCCAQEIARFAGTSDPHTAEWMAENCLLLADSGVDLGVVAAWADLVVRAWKDSHVLPTVRFCKGLAEYRQGHFAGAVDWLQKALSHEGDGRDRDVEAYMVLAMAQYRSNQADEARVTLAKGVEIAESKWPKLESGDLGDGWVNWIIAHVLMTEAKTLLDGAAKATAPP